jgi:hypothetical protein
MTGVPGPYYPKSLGAIHLSVRDHLAIAFLPIKD